MIRIKQLPACKRKHTRVRTPLVVEVGGVRLDVNDWSPGGLGVTSLPAQLLADTEADARVAVPIEGVWLTFEARLRVVRVGPREGDAGLAFVSLPGPGRELLHYVSQAAVDGEPATVSGVLDKVDPALLTGGDEAPIAPVAPTQATVAAPADAPAERPPAAPVPGTGVPAPASTPVPPPQEKEQAWRPPARILLHLTLGALLATYLGAAIYQRVWRIEVETAAIVAPTARIVAPADGVLRELAVSAGDLVKPGDRLFEITSPRGQAELEEAALAVSQAQVQVGQLTAERKAHEARLAIYRRIVGSRISAEKAQVRYLRERLGYAEGQVKRLQDLRERNLVSQLEVEDYEDNRANLAGQMEQARSLLSTEQSRLTAAKSGYYFDGDRIEQGLPEIDAALAAARADVELKKGQLEAARKRIDEEETVRAPFEGRVAEIEQSPGTPVRNGGLVVTLEEEEGRLVEAWLTREEAEYVRIGDVARISVAGLGHTYDGVVRSIDTDAEASARASASGGTPRLRAMLEPQGYAGRPDTADEALAELRDSASVGLPVVVSFSRSWR